MMMMMMYEICRRRKNATSHLSDTPYCLFLCITHHLEEQKAMPKITEGVEFDTIAREWRCKWSPDNDKHSLQELQAALVEFGPEIKQLDGVKVQRIVCGGCMDFKVIISLPEGKVRSLVL
jgi:phage tail sheath gpL-like